MPTAMGPRSRTLSETEAISAESSKSADQVGTPGTLDELAIRMDAFLRCGHPKLRFNIRRYWAVLNVASGERDEYADEWRPARIRRPDGSEIDRLMNPKILARHLAGDYDIAPEAPGFCSYAVLDLDRDEPRGQDGTPDPDLVVSSQAKLDATLAAVWRAFEFGRDKQPIVLRSPGFGYHVWLVFDRPLPLGWVKQWISARLHACGIAPRQGVIEVFPSGVPLRAPCGRGSALLVPRNPDDPDHLQLEAEHVRLRGKNQEVRLIRQYAAAFLAAVEKARRPFEVWVKGAPAWDEVWGPWGKREKNDPETSGENALSQHNGEELPAGGAGAPSGFLLYGSDYLVHVSKLLSFGISESGTRHDSVLKVTYYFAVIEGLPEGEVFRKVEEWLRGRPHESRYLHQHGSERFVKQCLVEARHYFRSRLRFLKGRKARPYRTARLLGPADFAVLEGLGLGLGLAPELRKGATQLLGWIAGFADAKGCVPGPVRLSSGILERELGDTRLRDAEGRRRRLSTVLIEELQRLGILTLYRDYSTAKHGREYLCWYVFGSGRLPGRREDGQLVLAVRSVIEGDLAAVSAGEPGSAATVELVRPAKGVVDGPRAWWRRMYAQRLFTPAEFLEAAPKTVVPGPFEVRPPKAQAGAAPPVLGEVVSLGEHTGTVKDFSYARGYGFIAVDNGASAFVYQEDIDRIGFRDLLPGAQVIFELVSCTRGPRALTVRSGKPVALDEVACVEDPGLREALAGMWRWFKARTAPG